MRLVSVDDDDTVSPANLTVKVPVGSTNNRISAQMSSTETVAAAAAANPTPADFEELKATHTPLISVAYFIQSHCKEYNDDFMLCKRQSADPTQCALEGRKVTRCVIDLFNQLGEKCPQVFDKHWQCLEQNNNYYWKCRTEERAFNQCVFQHFGYKKTIPDAPGYEIPVHMREDKDRWYK